MEPNECHCPFASAASCWQRISCFQNKREIKSVCMTVSLALFINFDFVLFDL